MLLKRGAYAETNYLCAANLKFNNMEKNTKEEYKMSKGRDWVVFIISTIAMFAILFTKPEWVWVAWPFQFTALAGALGRL
jgi:hypothetical protein